MKASDFNRPGVLEPREPGGAIHTSATGKGVSLREVAAATFAAGNQPFSLSLWVKPSGFRRNDWGNCFSYGAASTGCACSWPKTARRPGEESSWAPTGTTSSRPTRR